MPLQARTDGAARGELSLLRLSRVGTEEDKCQILQILTNLWWWGFSISFLAHTDTTEIHRNTGGGVKDV